jgi:hypothetical protein
MKEQENDDIPVTYKAIRLSIALREELECLPIMFRHKDKEIILKDLEAIEGQINRIKNNYRLGEVIE